MRRARSEGVYNGHPLGVRYDEGVDERKVYNKDVPRVPDGVAFNVSVSVAADPSI